jgi:hypothetical protein
VTDEQRLPDMTDTRQNSTALPRATLTRWLCVAVFLLLSGKSTALEIAGHGRSASWTQIGATFTSSGGSGWEVDKPGSALSFSEDGSRLLVGSANSGTSYVDVYEWQTGSSAWTLLGARISPPDSDVKSACLSGDGNVVAIADYYSDFSSGAAVFWWMVAVYHIHGTSGSWQRVGSDIVGSSSEGFMVKVSLSSDGKTLAIGNSDNTLESYDSSDHNATMTGRVRIYQWPANDLSASDVAWTQMGEPIEAWSTSSGYHHSFGPYSRKVYMDAGTLSGDGKRVAVFQSWGEFPSQEGYVYEWKSSSWSVVGDPISLVKAASISYDGNVVAGSYGSVYKWSSGAWSKTGLTDWYGDDGYKVSLSRDGTRVAYGYPWYGADIVEGTYRGIVVVYQWDSEAESWGRMLEIRGESAGDEAGYRVSLSGDGSRVAVYSGGDNAKHTRVFEVGTACDTSVAPPNAAVGNCPAELEFGSSCQPTCDSGYVATNPTTTCVSGYLKNATCTPVNYCLPSQEWQYDCRESDDGSLTCSIDQQPCGGGCDDGTTGSTDDQCNQCLSDGHEGLDGGATCDGSCTPGDVSDPCFKGFTRPPPPPPQANYCLPSQEWQYDCGPEPYDGSLTCPIDQQSCGGGCDDGTTGSTYDQCNQCLSNGHKGLDGGTTCDGSCTPGDVSDPCFKGFTQSPSKPPPPPPPPSAKVQAEKTRDSILAGITDESLKKKAKLLADAAIGGNAIKKLTAKLTAPDAVTACSDYYKKAGLFKKPGACVATAAAGGRRRRLAAAAYIVEVFFSSAEIDDDELTKARDALKAEGIEATLDENVDIFEELEAIDGVDASDVKEFKTQSTAVVAATEKKPPLPPPPPPPPSPPPPKLVLDEEDATPRLGAGSAAFASACAFLTVAMFA